jgi:hypothetical protein
LKAELFHFSARPGYQWKVFLLFLLLFNWIPVSATTAWPNIFMSAEQQQIIERQRESHARSAHSNALLLRSEEASQVDFEVFSITAILSVEGQRLAVINGISYRERMAKNGIHVHRIYEDSVTLTLEQTKQWGRAKVGLTYTNVSWPNQQTSSFQLSIGN